MTDSSELRQRTQKDRKDSDDVGPALPQTRAPTRHAGGFAMDPWSRLRRACIFVVVVLVMVSTIVLVVDIVVETKIDPEEFSLPSPPEFVGALAQNKALSFTERIYEDRLRGPESIIVRNGDIYTGTADGRILHISKDKISLVANLGKPPCGKFEDEPTCGRPLGMRFDKDGYLIIADAYLGLFKVDVVSGEVEQLFSSKKKVAGKRPRFLNDLDIASDGTIYITDSSTTWDRRHNRLAIMEARPDGRLLKFEPKTKQMSLVKDGFYLANGAQLSPKHDFILVSESTRCRIFKYHLKGPKAGRMEVFAENLPGLPDNIRPSSRGGYWVSIAFARLPGFEVRGYDFMASRPWLRRLATKLFGQETLARFIGRPYGLLLELNQDGEIIRSLHDPKGKTIPAISEVEDVNGVLYMGSYFSPFIGKLDITSIN